MQRIGLLLTLCAFLTVTTGEVVISEAGPPPAYTKEHAITIDATTLHPPSWWYVPGVTPLIWSMDPENTEAYRTSTARELRLKPGSYRFGTFTFDFPFTVNLDGVLEYPTTLDQCVSGRATQTLTIRCSKTQPYGGQPEYTVK
ncbi:MAG: hypothetical protein M3Z35_10780 [Nitrospirota bacterium]|nr:hypothetical protein [Nitrospirota bacterium]